MWIAVDSKTLASFELATSKQIRLVNIPLHASLWHAFIHWLEMASWVATFCCGITTAHYNFSRGYIFTETSLHFTKTVVCTTLSFYSYTTNLAQFQFCSINYASDTMYPHCCMWWCITNYKAHIRKFSIAFSLGASRCESCLCISSCLDRIEGSSMLTEMLVCEWWYAHVTHLNWCYKKVEIHRMKMIYESSLSSAARYQYECCDISLILCKDRLGAWLSSWIFYTKFSTNRLVFLDAQRSNESRYVS